MKFTLHVIRDEDTQEFIHTAAICAAAPSPVPMFIHVGDKQIAQTVQTVEILSDGEVRIKCG